MPSSIIVYERRHVGKLKRGDAVDIRKRFTNDGEKRRNYQRNYGSIPHFIRVGTVIKTSQ